MDEMLSHCRRRPARCWQLMAQRFGGPAARMSGFTFLFLSAAGAWGAFTAHG